MTHYDLLAPFKYVITAMAAWIDIFDLNTDSHGLLSTNSYFSFDYLLHSLSR